MNWIWYILLLFLTFPVLGMLFSISSSIFRWWIGLPLVAMFGIASLKIMEFIGMKDYWPMHSGIVGGAICITGAKYYIESRKMSAILGNDIIAAHQNGKFDELPKASLPMAQLMLQQAHRSPGVYESSRLISMFTNALIVLSIVTFIGAFIATALVS